MCEYLGSIVVEEGYNGKTVTLYLVQDSAGTVYAVHTSGYYPAQWLA